MIKLSYSTLNAIQQCPHVWLNKINGLKTYQTQAMTEGKAAHKIIQSHVSGSTPHDLLGDLPLFSVVETMDFDTKTKIEMPWNDTYSIIGYADGLNPSTGDILEIKSSSKPWSVLDFARLMQWRMYALALDDYKKIWLVNTPRTVDLWRPDNIRVFNKEITDNDKQLARDFIAKGIDVIENIDKQRLYVDKPSYYCKYIGCPYGCSKGDYARNQI